MDGVVDTLERGWGQEVIFEMDLSQFLLLRASLMRLEKTKLRMQFDLARVAMNGDAAAVTQFLKALA